MIFVDSSAIVTTDRNNIYSIVSSKFHSPGNQIDRIWYKTTGTIRMNSDVFLVSTLIPAMKLGEDLHVAGGISNKLYNNIPQIQDILSTWYPELKRIKVMVNATTEDAVIMNMDKKVACFFSGGVDSFYTLLKHNTEITTLIYIRGFDVNLHEIDYMDMMSAQLRKIADQLCKELIEVETNIHVFGDQYVDWSHQYHGSALGSIANLLSDQISKVYIPSSYTYKNVFPWGTHPLLDRLWATDGIEIIHDGCEASRVSKVQAIISNQFAMNHLRVCIDRTKGLYNCGECEKCIRTMISLYALGALSKCKTFSELNLDQIRNMKIDEHSFIFEEENFNILPEGDVKSALGLAIIANDIKK